MSARVEGIELPDPVFRVFDDAEAFAEFQRRAAPGLPPQTAGVDFSRRQLVLVSPGPRSSTGYGVRVLDVVERRRSRLVRVRELAPRLGDPVRAGVTYPYRLLALPRADTPVRIDWKGH